MLPLSQNGCQMAWYAAYASVSVCTLLTRFLQDWHFSLNISCNSFPILRLIAFQCVVQHTTAQTSLSLVTTNLWSARSKVIRGERMSEGGLVAIEVGWTCCSIPSPGNAAGVSQVKIRIRLWHIDTYCSTVSTTLGTSWNKLCKVQRCRRSSKDFVLQAKELFKAIQERLKPRRTASGSKTSCAPCADNPFWIGRFGGAICTIFINFSSVLVGETWRNNMRLVELGPAWLVQYR